MFKLVKLMGVNKRGSLQLPYNDQVTNALNEIYFVLSTLHIKQRMNGCSIHSLRHLIFLSQSNVIIVSDFELSTMKESMLFS
jgi:hypothetical protein